MFDNSDIEYSENEESDSDGEANIAEEKESSKTPSKKQHNKEDLDSDDEPVIPERIFTGVSGPRHTLNPSTANPFDYFCLFIPIFFTLALQPTQTQKQRWSQKRKMGMCAIGRPLVQPKWFVIVMWFCFMKGLSIDSYLKGKMDQNHART